MTLTEQLDAADVEVTRRTHDGHEEIVADFGAAPAATVDVVDGTVIVVANDDQHEFQIEGDAEVFMQNGVLTIEVKE